MTKTYSVTLFGNASVYATIEVEANSEEEANEIAGEEVSDFEFEIDSVDDIYDSEAYLISDDNDNEEEN